MYMREKLKVETEAWKNEISPASPESTPSSTDRGHQDEELQARHSEEILLPLSFMEISSHVEEFFSTTP
jgi:hypothetical protein